MPGTTTISDGVESFWDENEDWTNRLSNNNYEINRSLAEKLTRVFDVIKGTRKNTLDETGLNVDIRQYVNSKLSNNPRVFKTDIRKSGLNIVLVHDMSGSMNEVSLNSKGEYISRSQIATNTIATMYKAIQKYPEIKLNVIGFSGRDPYHLQSVKVNKINQVGILNNTIDITILDLALIEAEKYLNKLQGKKFVIVLTDGLPQSPTEKYNEYYSYLVKTLFIKKQIGVFGILIGDNIAFMKNTFGKNFALSTEQNTEKELIKIFEKTVRDNFQ